MSRVTASDNRSQSTVLRPTAWGLFPRLLFYLLAVAAFPLIVVSTLAELSARSVLVEAQAVQLSSLAGTLGRSLDAYLAERRADMALLATMPSVRTLAQEAAWDAPARRDTALEVLRASAATTSGDDTVTIVDRGGIARISTDSRLVGQNLAGVPAVQAALQGRTSVGDLVNEGGEPTLNVAVPVESRDGPPAAALLLRLRPNELWALMEGARPGASGYAVLVDDRGIVIGHSGDRSRLFTPFSGMPTTAPDVGALLGVTGGQGQIAEVHRLTGRPWTVVVAQPEVEVLAPLGRFRDASRVTGLVAFLLAGVVAAAVAYSIAMPIRRIRMVLARVADGDLSERVHMRRRDELGLLSEQVDGALSALATLVADARMAADAASDASAEIAHASQQQAAAMAQIAATVEELTRSAEQVALSADSTFQVAETARGHVTQGVRSLDAIKDRSGTLGDRLAALAEMGQRIGDVAGVIEDITNKTHLLSVNAAIEAATAGEFGRRFAVVAQQVKQLADETRSAAGEVKSLIRQTQSAAAAAVLASEGVVREVDLGASVSRETHRAIDQMVQQVRTISLATQQQLTANRQVSDAVSGTTDAMRQVAEAVFDLEQRVRALRMRLDELGAGGASLSESAAAVPTPPTADNGRLAHAPTGAADREPVAGAR